MMSVLDRVGSGSFLMRVSLSRVIGWTFVGLAAVATGAEFDRYQSLDRAQGAWSPVTSISVWELFGGDTLESFRAFSAEYLHPAVWDPGLKAVLGLPPAALLLGLGLFFLLVGRLRAGQVIPEPRGALRAGMGLVGAAMAILGLAVFGADLAIDATGVTLEERSTAALWQEIHPDSLAVLQVNGEAAEGAAPGQQATASPASESSAPESAGVVAAVLGWPAWQVLLGPGGLLLLLSLLGRRTAKRRAIPIPSGPRARTAEGERVLEKRAQFLDQMQERPRPPRREPRHPIPPASGVPAPTPTAAHAPGEGHEPVRRTELRDGVESRPADGDEDPHALRLVKD